MVGKVDGEKILPGNVSVQFTAVPESYLKFVIEFTVVQSMFPLLWVAAYAVAGCISITL